MVFALRLLRMVCFACEIAVCLWRAGESSNAVILRAVDEEVIEILSFALSEHLNLVATVSRGANGRTHLMLWSYDKARFLCACAMPDPDDSIPNIVAMKFLEPFPALLTSDEHVRFTGVVVIAAIQFESLCCCWLGSVVCVGRAAFEVCWYFAGCVVHAGTRPDHVPVRCAKYTRASYEGCVGCGTHIAAHGRVIYQHTRSSLHRKPSKVCRPYRGRQR
jgi:hypothetical protein